MQQVEAKESQPRFLERNKEDLPELDYPHQGGRAETGRFPVPQTSGQWRDLSRAARDYVAEHGLVAPLSLAELQDHGAALTARAGADTRYSEFLMVLLNNEVWRDVVAAIPYDRRTLLLPPCLRSSDTCKAEFDEYGLLCERCGSCSIGRLSAEAEDLGYAVLAAEGTSIVSSLIGQGMIDAVIGVSCMASLERAFHHMAATAVPGLAVPLLKDGCEDTVVDVERAREFIHLKSDGAGEAQLDLRAVHEEVRGWFTESNVRPILGSTGTETERIAVSWLAKSGKRWRPFLVVCVYKALRGADAEPLPEAVKQVAVAVECIHKASLIYDDIQDDDEMRYGDPTVHRSHGTPVALTASLYLLGQGYRLIADCDMSAGEKAVMLSLATEGHCELCVGQGGELCWMRDPEPLSPTEVLDIFRLKTAPSFEVVFRLGAVCGGASDDEHEILKKYSQALGVAYQIQDDMKDFKSGGDVDDIKAGRPSILMALAYREAGGAARDAVAAAWCGRDDRPDPDAIRGIMTDHDVEKRAREVLAQYKDEALNSLRPLKNRNLKILLHRLIGKVFPEPG